LKQVGVYDAKTHLARLLDEVETGQEITITRHGKPIARLVPLGPRRRSVAEAIDAIRQSRKGRTLGGVRIRDLIDEGRKH
jgi:prevent-host-death family protein